MRTALSTLALTVCLLTTLPASAQAPSTSYTLNGCEVVNVFTKDGEFVTRMPFGNDGTVTYDAFFKRYRIHFTEANGSRGFLTLNYIQAGPDGTSRYHDDYDNTFLLWDAMPAERGLRLTPENAEFHDGMEAAILVSCAR